MKGKGYLPPTIVDLNDFILASFPPPQLHFDPDKHTIVRPFSPASGNLFYQQIGLPLEPPMKDKNSKHKFYNWDLAWMRLNINSDLLTPLVKYITNPLLTTIPFHSDLNPHFIGLCLESTDPEGWLVSRTKSFPTSSAGLRSASMNLDTKINHCAFCKGLNLLPSHWVYMVYFVPKDLQYITSEFLDVWQSSVMTVFTMHFLHQSKKASNGLIKDIFPNL